MTQEQIEEKCRVTNNIMRSAQQEIKECEIAIKKLQKICNHNKSDYHHRVCAEDDCYHTCLICGLEYK